MSCIPFQATWLLILKIWWRLGKCIAINFTIVTRNGKIIWKHGPNRPFYAFVLRTKRYWSTFFTVHQNVNKPKSRPARTVYGPIFLPFYVIIVSFFSFFCQDANKKGSNCAIIGCSFSKKQKLALHKTHSRELNYVDHKFFLYSASSYLHENLETESKYYRAG